MSGTVELRLAQLQADQRQQQQHDQSNTLSVAAYTKLQQQRDAEMMEDLETIRDATDTLKSVVDDMLQLFQHNSIRSSACMGESAKPQF